MVSLIKQELKIQFELAEENQLTKAVFDKI